jgi:hypothetical protein
MPPILPTAAPFGASPGLPGRLAEILGGLGALIARAFLRHPTHAALILPLWTWLNRTVRRFERVIARQVAGTLRPGTPRPGRKSGSRATPLPRTRGWLLNALRHEGAHYANRLDALLAEPEVAALLAATPQAQRLLRPLCHMLGIQPEALGKPLSPARRGKNASRPKPLSSPLPPSRKGSGEGGATRTASLLANLCPRLLQRWPFNQYRPA